MAAYGLRMRLIEDFIQTSPVFAERFLKWAIDKTGVLSKPSAIRFSRVRASGEIYSLPDDPDADDFTDDWSHLYQPQAYRLQRSRHGFIEPVPCTNVCEKKSRDCCAAAA